MRRDLIFIHSAGPQGGDNGSSRLIERLTSRLGTRFDLIAPDMPDPERPGIDAWLSGVDRVVSKASKGAVLVGHSLGGSVILQYLARNPDIWRENKSLSAVFIVASPFWGLTDWEIDEFTLTEDEVCTLEDCKLMHFCHSRDDRIVGFEHFQAYLDHLPSADAIILESAGHLMLDGDIDRLIKKILIYS
ncbi:alpha/beta fold hydrolase [Thalassospira profundimaris]|uniref:Alpha/beta hydrolase n=1 Tax=Thalassospira profundimaris TaxID=502049 RepID=A0A367X7W1_9PROT|nr:alpha/beta fold hydrolase [Thalassospira profundimaris]RCK49200.1 hypothetical protein TH30_02425 [Thalassospira profundimaris]